MMEQTSYLYIHSESTGYIHFWELLLAPFFLSFLYLGALILRNKFYKNSPLKKYFLPALTVKLIGAIGLCLIYSYYYKGGDTCNYFNEGKNLSSVIYSNPYDGLRLLFSTGGEFAPDLLKYFPSMEFVGTENTYMVIKITALFEVITLQSFLITSILFGFFSFWAIWKLFTVFYEYEPRLLKEFATAFLFMPSVYFWGSGILKDTVCLSSLAILFYSIDGFFLKKRNQFSNGIGIIVTGYLLTIVKVYIIISFSVCVILFIILTYRSKIKSNSLRLFITPIMIFSSLLGGLLLIQFINSSSITDKYTTDKLLETSAITREYISSLGGGSTYSLGEIDNSTWGLIKIFPAGVNVTLFRPYIWEAHNAVALISALESLFILLLTLKIIYTTGIFRFFRLFFSKNLILFCLTFSIIFAFSVGISSYNFGTLVRYKIPCIPFYMAGIQLIKIASEKKEARKRKNLHAPDYVQA